MLKKFMFMLLGLIVMAGSTMAQGDATKELAKMEKKYNKYIKKQPQNCYADAYNYAIFFADKRNDISYMEQLAKTKHTHAMFYVAEKNDDDELMTLLATKDFTPALLHLGRKQVKSYDYKWLNRIINTKNYRAPEAVQEAQELINQYEDKRIRGFIETGQFDSLFYYTKKEWDLMKSYRDNDELYQSHYEKAVEWYRAAHQAWKNAASKGNVKEAVRLAKYIRAKGRYYDYILSYTGSHNDPSCDYDFEDTYNSILRLRWWNLCDSMENYYKLCEAVVKAAADKGDKEATFQYGFLKALVPANNCYCAPDGTYMNEWLEKAAAHNHIGALYCKALWYGRQELKKSPKNVKTLQAMIDKIKSIDPNYEAPDEYPGYFCSPIQLENIIKDYQHTTEKENKKKAFYDRLYKKYPKQYVDAVYKRGEVMIGMPLALLQESSAVVVPRYTGQYSSTYYVTFSLPWGEIEYYIRVEKGKVVSIVR